MIDWVLNLTPHQLDVLRTVAVIIGTGCVPLFGFVLTWLGRAIRLNTRQTMEQTRTSEWTDGKLHVVPISDSIQQVRQEITDFYNDPPLPKHHGRRRLPTTEIPAGLITEESHYD